MVERRTTLRALVASWLVLLLMGSAVPSLSAQGDPGTGSANSVIFFLGDGMGQAERDAAQLVTVGPYGNLTMDGLDYAGLVGTDSVDPETFITDSAASATSYATGVKTFNGAIGVDANGDTVTNVAELAKAQGKSVGVVTTSQVTDASGAAFVAHVQSRRDQSEIARQMIEDVGVDVILGGGEDRWLPEGNPGAYPDNPAEDLEEQSQSDQGDLISRAQELGYTYVSDAAGLDGATEPKLLGLFANEEMFQQNPEGQGDIYDPIVSLDQMTSKAIEILSQNPEGFFLFVEEEAVDEMGHANNSELTIKAVQELDKAVASGVEYAQANPDTLLLVTADHETGGMTIESADNPEYPDESGPGGTAGTDAATPTAGETTISGEDGPFAITGTGYEFFVDWTSTGHTGVRIPLTAMGPGAENLTGYYENTHVFEVMVNAMGLEMPAGIPATPVPGATPVS